MHQGPHPHQLASQPILLQHQKLKLPSANRTLQPRNNKGDARNGNIELFEFLTALHTLAQEDTTQIHEAVQHHQNLIRKYPNSFPITFHKIQLHGYTTRALEDRIHTLD